MGDWGSNDKGQAAVATDMAKYIQSQKQHFDGMLLAGDNFYVPLDDGIRDAKWNKMFEHLYDPASFNFPFYVALGNHDYLADRFMIEFAYAQANPQSRWKMPARWYRLDLPKENPIVTVLVLDSNQPWLGELGWAAELKWMQAELAKPRKPSGSSPSAIIPSSPTATTATTASCKKPGARSSTKPTKISTSAATTTTSNTSKSQASNNPSSSSAAGGDTRPERLDNRGPFSKSTHGFAHLNFTSDLATVKLIGENSEIIHSFTRTPEGQITITTAGKSDTATPRKIGDVSRGGTDKTKD